MTTGLYNNGIPVFYLNALDFSTYMWALCVMCQTWLDIPGLLCFLTSGYVCRVGLFVANRNLQLALRINEQKRSAFLLHVYVGFLCGVSYLVQHSGLPVFFSGLYVCRLFVAYRTVQLSLALRMTEQKCSRFLHVYVGCLWCVLLGLTSWASCFLFLFCFVFSLLATCAWMDFFVANQNGLLPYYNITNDRAKCLSSLYNKQWGFCVLRFTYTDQVFLKLQISNDLELSFCISTLG